MRNLVGCSIEIVRQNGREDWHGLVCSGVASSEVPPPPAPSALRRAKPIPPPASSCAPPALGFTELLKRGAC